MRTPWDPKLVVARFPAWHVTVRVSGACEIRPWHPRRDPVWWGRPRLAVLPPDRLAVLRDRLCTREFRNQDDCIGDGEHWVQLTLYEPPHVYDTTITWGSRKDHDPPLDAVAPAYLVEVVTLLGELTREGR